MARKICPTHPAGLLAKMVRFIRDGRPFALATVLDARGSTPVPAGARALVEPDGTVHGTVGGGSVEAEAIRRATRTVARGKPELFTLDLLGPRAEEAEPICGGAMTVLVNPASREWLEHAQRALVSLKRRERGIWLTQLPRRPGLPAPCWFLSETGLGAPPVLDLGARFRASLAACLDCNRPETLVVPSSRVAHGSRWFAEPLGPAPRIVIVGGGHVGQAVARQADLLGYEIVVLEDRPEFARRSLFPRAARVRCGDVPAALAALPLDALTFVVVVTRGHRQDAAALRACIGRQAGYIGMIGSRRKVPLLRRQFIASSWATPAAFDAVCAPIGIDIGAVTVPEIAVSILAQIVAVHRTGATPRMPR